MAALADKTGLSRETLYRTLSERGNHRLDTLAVILAAFGFRLTVQLAQKSPLRQCIFSQSATPSAKRRIALRPSVIGIL
jgi:transcriptional regulator with XRE-family HTH domain